MPDLASAMRAAARALVEHLDLEQRRQLVLPFRHDLHTQWTYLPGLRPGLRIGDLSDVQLAPALDLLELVHSVRGWSDAQLVIRLEAVRRELSLQQAGRPDVDPYRDLPYWLVVLGDPRAASRGPGGSTATICWPRPRSPTTRSGPYRSSSARSRPR